MKMENRPTEITRLLSKEHHHKLTANLMFFISRNVFSENLVAMFMNKMKPNLVNHSYVLHHTIQFWDSGYENTHTLKKKKVVLFSFRIIFLE
jgi:hypothetical protein